MENVIVKMGLPGFRFHPTEEELIDFYLKNFALGKRLYFDVIGFLNIYHYNPWDLPALSKINGEREWYFFVPRDKKNGHGGRPNRTTETGFWKATGSDRKIRPLTDPKKILGLRKTLVFYLGRAPRGSKTDWVMNEYRLPNSPSFSKIQDEIVLCKIYRKATSLRVLEQRAAAEEASRISNNLTQYSLSSPQTQESSLSCNSQLNTGFTQMPLDDNIVLKAEEAAFSEGLETKAAALPGNLTGLQLQMPKFDMDWTVLDPLHGAPLRSPWLDNWNACGTQVAMKSFFDM